MTVSWLCAPSGSHSNSLLIIDYCVRSAETSSVACTSKHVKHSSSKSIVVGDLGSARSTMADSKANDHHSPNETNVDDDGLQSESKEFSYSCRNSMQGSGKDKINANMASDNFLDSIDRDHTNIAIHPIDFQKREFTEDLAAAASALKNERHFSLLNASAPVVESVRPTVMGIGANYTCKDVVENTNALSASNVCRLLETANSGSTEQRLSTSLRVWLDTPARVIDKIENLHIFKQIAEFVELAHSQGVLLRNVRPSSFLISSASHISIIDSASSNASSSSSAESTSRGPASNFMGVEQMGLKKFTQVVRDSTSIRHMSLERHADFESPPVPTARLMGSTRSGILCEDDTMQRQEIGKHVAEDEGGRSYTSSSSEHADTHVNDEKFPLKELLSLEMMWYKSPEELNGGTPDFPADMYSLGVLFVELFCNPRSRGERSRAMSDLRHRLLPPSFLLEFPKEAAFCLLLLHPNPEFRPKAREILRADIFSETEDKIAEREVIMRLEEKMSEAEITLDFLLQMQQRKHVISQKLARELKVLNEDIGEVKRWQALLMKNRCNESFKNESIMLAEASSSDVGGSKVRNDLLFASEQVPYCHSQDGPSGRRQELLLAKSAQLIKSFTNFREFYFSLINQYSCVGSAHEYMNPRSEQSEKSGVMSFANNLTSYSANQGGGGRLGCFFDDFCKFMKYSKFDVRATLQYGDILNTKNMVCSLNFDCDDEYFATAGVSRKIKVFDCNALLKEFNDVHYPVIEMNSRKKLSCICWNKFHKNFLSSSDLEGAVQVWDVTAGQTITELKEHHKCAWSVDFSHFESTRLVSGSDDCCVKLWSTNQSTSIGTIKTKANICSVQFSPVHSHILAFGSADSQVYFHDLRYVRIPICILTGHQKAVSFIKFTGSSSIVSSSTDNTLKLWDFTKTSTITGRYNAAFRSKGHCIRTYTGHTNLKNFVGLSVAEEGYIACGSETNEVFVYHKSLPVTMLSHKFKSADPISGKEMEDLGDQFVSSVCWRNRSQVLVIANSVGNIQVLEMA